jgi:hypothetical protein
MSGCGGLEQVLGTGRIVDLPNFLVYRVRPVQVKNPIGPILLCLPRTARERDSRWRRERL